MPQKALFWQEKQMLILTDIHLGNAGHMRKFGIAMPLQLHQHDLATLEELIEYYHPATVIILDDLFHSQWNAQWTLLTQWLERFKYLQWLLVCGNCDVLPKQLYCPTCKWLAISGKYFPLSLLISLFRLLSGLITSAGTYTPQ
ncbi:MAG: hypothetical protein RMJ44_08750 [Cytophagales bacterium]|nr:hypothetical protein [Bernardetiaceae bacterium]MDW8211162.1 hypothetical protein [Cytophagales bacterium]